MWCNSAVALHDTMAQYYIVLLQTHKYTHINIYKHTYVCMHDRAERCCDPFAYALDWLTDWVENEIAIY